MVKKYERPVIKKVRNSELVLKALRNASGKYSCRQCSGCHGCR